MNRRQREWDGPIASTSAAATSATTTRSSKAALASAYQELGRELSSAKLKTVGTYTLGRPIGEGTFGKVRIGIHRLTGQRVAIKQVPKAHSASLTREIHHHRRLHHANVMQLYEVLATESHIWMVSELCSGGELYDYLVERETMPEHEARRLFGQLCLALAYIHAKGIVHRDLKLENVLLDERCNIKLGDFGFTREFEPKRLMDTFCGTTGYAAPEMLAGKRYTGQEVDIWSLGVILYALLCGTLPFDDDDDDVMKAKILKGDYELPDTLSEEARDLIKSILVQDPNARPSIRSILSHAWFHKVLTPVPMSPVDEKGVNLGDVPEANDVGGQGEEKEEDEEQARGRRGLEGQTERVGPEDGQEDVVAAASSSSNVAADVANTAAPAGGSSTSEMDHRASESAFSEASFVSAQSDGSSSDQRSTQTATTNPTTEADSDDAEAASDAAVNAAATETPPGVAPRLALHRNESQSTIRRQGSASSSASKNTHAGGTAAKAAVPSLPTHDESPGASEAGPAESPGDGKGAATPMSATPSSTSAMAAQSTTLVKRGSQSSSKGGHHRTPSRTKRRSLSSNGLSDHHHAPPHPSSRPVDYLSQLEQAGTPLFTTPAEQALLHSLSALGLDVGQVVHSVVTDACDATGALWWILRMKQQQKRAEVAWAAEAEQAVVEVERERASTTSAAPLAKMPPPPLPPKDPARRGSRSESSSPVQELAAGRDDSVLAAAAVAATAATATATVAAAAAAAAAAAENGPAEAPGSAASAAATKGGKAQPSKLARAETSRAATRGKAGSRAEANPPPVLSPSTRTTSLPAASAGVAPAPGVGTPKGKPARPERGRTNSLSIKIGSVLGLDKKDSTAAAAMAAVTSAAVVAEQKQAAAAAMTTAGGPAASPTPNASRRDRTGGAEVTLERSKSPVSVGTLFGKRGVGSSSPSKATPPPSAVSSSLEREAQRLMVAAESRGSGSASPVGSSGRANANGGATLTSLSAETFSTLSNQTPEPGEAGADATLTLKKGKSSKSSFLSTVRTWLGTEKEAARRRKKAAGGQGNLASAGGSKSTAKRGAGSAAATYAMTRSGSVRSRQGSQAISNGTLRSPRAAAHHARTSTSRRSSTGSVSGHPPPPVVRPPNARRRSAGSITPTAAAFGGDAAGVEVLSSSGPTSAPMRHSRPSSSHSHRGPVGTRLHAQRASQGSLGAGSVRHSRRLSHDGGTVVLRQRAMGNHSAARSESGSRPVSLYNAPGAVDSEAGEEESLAGGGEPSSAPPHHVPRRTSIDSRSAAGSVGEGTAGRTSSSVFVAHKSRSPYKHPMMHHHHHHHRQRQASGHGQGSGHFYPAISIYADLPPNGTGVWRRSWGRPPPSWAGPVDDDGPEPGATTTTTTHARPKLRDVFTRTSAVSGGGGGAVGRWDTGTRGGRERLLGEEEDDWEDEEEGTVYCGGLGQLDTMSGRGGGGGGGGGGSGFTNSFGGGMMGDGGNGRQIAGSGGGMGFVTGSPRPGTGFVGMARYANVRTLFQPPSLGRETAPRLLSATLDATAAMGGGASTTAGVANATTSASSTLPPGVAPSSASSLSSSDGAPSTTTTTTTDAASSEAATAGVGTALQPPPPPTTTTTTNNPGPAAAVAVGVGAAAGSRIRGAQAPAFKSNIIEEEEEDE